MFPASQRSLRPGRGEVLVIGLGRFGRAVARELRKLGHEVLGVDADQRIVQELSTELTHVLQVDSTNLQALKQIGAAEFQLVVVGIGGDIESSILTTSALVDLGVPNIWAKAITEPHKRILERIGAHHVVLPEAESGARVAHLVTGHLIDFIELDDTFVLAELPVPATLCGKTLIEAELRSTHHITVVCIKQPGGTFTYATPETRLELGALVVVAGPPKVVERFAELD